METRLTPEDESKDRFFRRLAELSEEMIASHGKDFCMGALVLCARWVAEDRVGAEHAAGTEAATPRGPLA